MAERILIAQGRSGRPSKLAGVLERAGYRTLETDDLLEALKLLRRSLDLMLLEAELAWQVHGQFWVQLAEFCATADIPCLLYSFCGKSRRDLEELAPWVADAICHPRDPEEVLAWVRSRLTIHHLARRLRAVHGELQLKQEELEEGLRSAAHIRKCLVPDTPPAIQNIHFAWRFLPCANAGGEPFGEKRFFRVLAELRGEELETVCERVVDELRSFADGAPMEDDVTLFGIECHGRG